MQTGLTSVIASLPGFSMVSFLMGPHMIFVVVVVLFCFVFGERERACKRARERERYLVFLPLQIRHQSYGIGAPLFSP